MDDKIYGQVRGGGHQSEVNTISIREGTLRLEWTVFNAIESENRYFSRMRGDGRVHKKKKLAPNRVGSSCANDPTQSAEVVRISFDKHKRAGTTLVVWLCALPTSTFFTQTLGGTHTHTSVLTNGILNTRKESLVNKQGIFKNVKYVQKKTRNVHREYRSYTRFFLSPRRAETGVKGDRPIWTPIIRWCSERTSEPDDAHLSTRWHYCSACTVLIFVVDSQVNRRPNKCFRARLIIIAEPSSVRTRRFYSYLHPRPATRTQTRVPLTCAFRTRVR